MPARIALADVDRTSFHVTPHDLPEIGRVVTIVPHKTKFHWGAADLPFRSLMTDPDGVVLSSGWPKFFNLGEHAPHDAEFATALAAGDVTFADKQDGSLLILDHVRGHCHARTRGAPALMGDFADAIGALLAAHPALTAWLAAGADADARDYSWLFEYTGPAHRIVCRADVPRLTLLGYVDKATLTMGWDPARLGAVADRTGVPVTPTRTLPLDRAALIAEVRRWEGCEGVVARFRAADGAPRLLKLKSDWYRTLHALRFGMTPNRARKLCYLLGVTAMADVAPAFARLGADFEICEEVTPALEAYFARRAAVHAGHAALVAALAPARAAADRKAYAAAVAPIVDAFLASGGAPGERRDWLGIAYSSYGNDRGTAALVLEAIALEERPPSLTRWTRDRAAEVRATLAAASAEIPD